MYPNKLESYKIVIMHKMWIRNTKQDVKIYNEDKPWQIVTRSVFLKSITDYNFKSKVGVLTKSGCNELEISRVVSPDMNKAEFNLKLDSFKNPKMDPFNEAEPIDNSVLDNMFGVSVKSKEHPEFNNFIAIDKNKPVPKKEDIDMKKQLEDAKRKLLELKGDKKGDKDDQSSTDDEEDKGPKRKFPMLRKICWNLMKFGIPALIIFTVLFVIIWYMMIGTGSQA